MFRLNKDVILSFTLRLCAILSGSIVLWIMLFLVIEAWPALWGVTPWRFASDASWHPTEGQFQLMPMAAATLVVMLGAVILATPLGILSAVFCHSYAPGPVGRVYRRLIELLAGIPSVVYGFWGLVVVVPWIASWRGPGASLLAGILILALMILPTIALLSEAALQNVPQTYHQGAAALGLSRWAVLWRVIIPAARPGMTTAVLLAGGRAAGETMAVLMVCGNVVQWPSGLLLPVRTLTANMAMEMGYAYGLHRSALFVTGLLLMGLVMAMVGVAQWMRHRDMREVAHG